MGRKINLGFSQQAKYAKAGVSGMAEVTATLLWNAERHLLLISLLFVPRSAFSCVESEMIRRRGVEKGEKEGKRGCAPGRSKMCGATSLEDRGGLRIRRQPSIPNNTKKEV